MVWEPVQQGVGHLWVLECLCISRGKSTWESATGTRGIPASAWEIVCIINQSWARVSKTHISRWQQLRERDPEEATQQTEPLSLAAGGIHIVRMYINSH